MAVLRTDFYQFLFWEGVVVLKELIFKFLLLEDAVTLKKLFLSFHFGRVWWS